jgi:cytochrome b559 beta subunit
MIIYKTRPIFTITWLAVHGVSIPTIFFLESNLSSQFMAFSPTATMWIALTKWQEIFLEEI